MLRNMPNKEPATNTVETPTETDKVKCAWRGCQEMFVPIGKGKKRKKYHSRHCFWKDWNEQNPRIKKETDSYGS